MPKLPTTGKPKLEWWKPLPKTALEVDIKSAIRSAINRLSYARLWLNQERKIEQNGRSVYVPGLGPGSSDLIGVVKRCNRRALMLGQHVVGYTDEIGIGAAGIFIAIEVKRPGQGPRGDQEEFMDIVSAHHGVAAVAHNVEEAVYAVARAAELPVGQVFDDIETASGKKMEF